MSQYIKRIRTDAGDLQIDYNELANKPIISNPNLLINSDFRNPINQRNATSYAYRSDNTSKVYGIDRWWLNGVNTMMTVQKQYLAVYLPSGCDFGQALELSYISYDNMTVSVKFYNDPVVKSATINGLSSQTESTERFVNLTNDVKVGFYVFDHGMYMFLRPIGSEVTLNIEWIKLESGSIATPFSPRNRSEEIILCQRFYRVQTINHDDIICPLYKRQNNSYCGLMSFESMRRIPTVTHTGNFYIEQHNSNGVFATMEDKITSIDIIPQWTELKFHIELNTVDAVNHLGTSSNEMIFRFDAEIG